MTIHTTLSMKLNTMVWAVGAYLQCRCRAPSLTLVNVTTWYGALSFTCHLV